MSAFIVGTGCINEILGAPLSENMISSPAEIQATGKMLLKENYKSVNFRYTETRKAPKTVFTPTSLPYLNIVSVVKQIQCLDYQSCEHQRWDRSKAKKLLDRLMCRMASKLARRDPSYDNIPWGRE